MHNRPRLSNVVLALAFAALATTASASAIRPTTVPSNLSTQSVEGYAVYGVTDTISTLLQLTTYLPIEGSLRLGDGRELTIAPDTSPNIAFAPLSGAPSVGAIKVSAINLDASTFVHFKLPTHDMGFEIPVLTEKVADTLSTTEIRQVTNPEDGSYTAALLLFNVSNERAWITATIYDDARPDKPAAREYILTEPHGALTWHDVETKFASGRIELTRGTIGFGCDECRARGEVYGFAAISSPNGDAPRVRPIIAKRAVAIFMP